MNHNIYIYIHIYALHNLCSIYFRMVVGSGRVPTAALSSAESGSPSKSGDSFAQPPGSSFARGARQKRGLPNYSREVYYKTLVLLCIIPTIRKGRFEPGYK